MTLEERLAVIEQKANSNMAKAKKEEADLQKRTQEALIKVQELTPRIQAVITVANKCVAEGINFPTDTREYGYGNDGQYNFFADGFYHHMGLMDCHRAWWIEGEKRYNPVEYLGIDEGGWNGVWDFYTNGTKTFLKHEKDGTVKDAELSYIKAFLDEFDTFEEAFYKWVDSLAK